MASDMKLDLPHVIERTNKSGAKRFYFRRRNNPMERLPDNPTSYEFMQAYEACLSKSGVYGSQSIQTFGWICDQYLDSATFSYLRPATQSARKRIIQTMLLERLDPEYPETYSMESADRISEKHVVILRDRKASVPNAANERIKILNQVFKYAIEHNHLSRNPARDVSRIKIRTEGHETANDEQIEQYLSYHTRGPAWLAMKLLTSFGVRISDLRVLGRGNIQNKQIVFTTIKSGVLCELDIPHKLLPHLRDMVFLKTENGSAFASDKAFSQRVSKWFRQAGIQGVTAHSIRKHLATKMAENGATEFELMSWFGWRDPKEARPYINKANRRKMSKSAGQKRKCGTFIELNVERTKNVK